MVVVRTGEQPCFEAHMAIPEMSGEIIAIEWEFFGNGNYEKGTNLRYEDDEHTRAVARAEFQYKEEGAVFIAVRAVANRNPRDIYTQIRNLDCVRVKVRSDDK